MAALDWVFAAILLASLLLGAWRGLVYEVLSVVSWIAGFLVAQLFAPGVAHSGHGSPERYLPVVQLVVRVCTGLRP